VVEENVTEALIPKNPDAIYYKAHSAHEGFKEAAAAAGVAGGAAAMGPAPVVSVSEA
jgi:hypothetical protein